MVLITQYKGLIEHQNESVYDLEIPIAVNELFHELHQYHSFSVEKTVLLDRDIGHQ